MAKMPKNHNLYATDNIVGRFYKVKTFGPSWVTVELLKYGPLENRRRMWYLPNIGSTQKVARQVFDTSYRLQKVLNV